MIFTFLYFYLGKGRMENIWSDNILTFTDPTGVCEREILQPPLVALTVIFSIF